MELKSFILSSQFRNRLCRDCNYCFRVLSPASRPCVGGVKLGDFSFVGNQLSRNLHSAPFNNEISKDDFFFLHCFLTHSKDDTWYIIHAFPSKISRCIGTLRTLEISPLWCAPRGMKNRREEESGSLEANKRIRLLWRTKDEIQSIPPFKWFSLLLVPVPNSSPDEILKPLPQANI
ncbi:hypothetical protein G4B88_024314 [Cannabis sativa]|uniref:Uncharacterized protein n=1 Tax=Cannabis sativa TaxID=3483 RepID=A0A7J6GGE3_CANSA|nr:hypothetical protein G4B88_024314 [Cannabis sativa]